MKSITYSFIIPHKNSPDLLERCIGSIPERDDIEIIVVDDNSDIDKTPQIHRQDVHVVLLDEEHCKGAGRARNVGLSLAKGKWLLFADCDDYYEENFMEKLDKYVNTAYDVVYFNFYNSIEGKVDPVNNKISNYIKKCYEGDLDIDYVKYRNNSPWNKMVRMDFVQRYKITFEEVPIANDMFFSFQVGYFAKKWLVTDDYLYHYISYKNSQTIINWSDLRIQCVLENIYKRNGFMKMIGRKDWVHGFFYVFYSSFNENPIKQACRIVCCYIRNYKIISNAENVYTNIIRKRLQELV